MALVLALGNPGSRYVHTRHNVAWWVAERLVARWSAEAAERTREYHAWRAAPGDREVHLLQPLTFMNLSGDALNVWRERHAFDIGELLVVSDDVYLPVGTLRIRASGSSGGHRGLESIEAALQSRDYARLRIGVGSTESDRLKQHVLEEFSQDEAERVEQSVATAADAVEVWHTEGLAIAMNRFNRRIRQEASES